MLQQIILTLLVLSVYLSSQAATNSGNNRDIVPAPKKLSIGASNPQVTVDIGGGSNNNLTGNNNLLIADDLEVDGDIYGTTLYIDEFLEKINFVSNVYFSNGASSNFIFTSNASGVGTWLAQSGGSSEWSANGDYIYPSDHASTRHIITGDTVLSSADHIFYDNGAAILNNAANTNNFVVRSKDLNHLFKVDSSNDRIGINIAAPLTSLHLNGNLTLLPDSVTDVNNSTGISQAMLDNGTVLTISKPCSENGNTLPVGAIAQGKPGQLLILKGRYNNLIPEIRSPTFFNGTTNTCLIASNRSMFLGAGDILVLKYSGFFAHWIEVSRADNTYSGGTSVVKSCP